MRILTVAAVAPNPDSGAAGTVWQINQALRRLGHQVEEIWNDDLSHRIKHGNLYSLLEQPRAYRKAICNRLNRSEFDVIDINQPQGFLAAKELKRVGFSGAVINRSHGVELLVNEIVPAWHRNLGVPESKFPRSLLTPVLRHQLEKQWPEVVRYSDGVIVSTQLDRDYLIRKLQINPEQVAAIQQGVTDNLLKTSPTKMTPDRLKKLLYVGQHAFIKGTVILADTVNRVLAACEHAEMTWVTSADAHTVIRDAISPAVTDRVNLVPWMPQDELLATYQTHGIFVFPSFYEGFGKAPFEAMAAGMCAVCSDTGGMRDIINDGTSGFLCQIGNAENFAKRIQELLAAPQLATDISVASRKAVQHLTWQRAAEETADFYWTCLERKNRFLRTPLQSV